jgi:hypothetical protein
MGGRCLDGGQHIMVWSRYKARWVCLHCPHQWVSPRAVEWAVHVDQALAVIA